MITNKMESSWTNKTWELVGIPKQKKIIGCKWVYRKRKSIITNRLQRNSSSNNQIYLYASNVINYSNVQFGVGVTRCEKNFVCGELEVSICSRAQNGLICTMWNNHLGNENMKGRSTWLGCHLQMSYDVRCTQWCIPKSNIGISYDARCTQ